MSNTLAYCARIVINDNESFIALVPESKSKSKVWFCDKLVEGQYYNFFNKNNLPGATLPFFL